MKDFFCFVGQGYGEAWQKGEGIRVDLLSDGSAREFILRELKMKSD